MNRDTYNLMNELQEIVEEMRSVQRVYADCLAENPRLRRTIQEAIDTAQGRVADMRRGG